MAQYNHAQATEKNRLQVLLHDLCRNLPDRERETKARGPKPHRVSDCVFATAFKVYAGLSSRRFSCDLLEAHEKGYTTRAIPGVKVTAFFEDEYFTPILKALIAQSAAPLRAVETDFAIDSSGFGSTRYERRYDAKYGHIACGVRTNVVTAVRILDQHTGDSPLFAPLVHETAKSFTISEVSADKAYSSLENFERLPRAAAKASSPSKRALRASSAVCSRRRTISSNSIRKSTWPITTSGAMSNRLSRRSSGSSAIR